MKVDPTTGYPIIEQPDELAQARAVAGPESDDPKNNE